MRAVVFSARCVAWLWALATAATPGAAAESVGLRPVRGFTADGNELVLAGGSGDGLLLPEASLAAGLYTFTAEYRTEGFAHGGKFAIDVKTRDWKTPLSGYECEHRAVGWVPTRVFFAVKTKGDAQVRVGNFRGAAGGAKVRLRGARIRPFALAGGVNLLANGDWEAGTVGDLPAMWEWRAKQPVPAGLGLATNRSFRSGRHVLRLLSEGKTAPVLYSHGLPLPAAGEIELSLWARSPARVPLTLHVVRQDWGSRAEKAVEPLENWKPYSVRWKIDPGDRPRFFVRLDMAARAGWVEVADVAVRWHPAPGRGGAAASPAAGSIETWAERFARLGWQGVPGENLLYNPDMELGGVGFFYDYSWPKKYADYAAIRATRPVRFVPGQGVDGGTCAVLENGTIRAYCFPVTTGKTYTFSADMRAAEGAGPADCSVLAFDSEWNCALWKRAAGIPADRWKRYHWTVAWKPRNIQCRGYVRFGSSGGVRVDRIQVVEGTEAAWQPPPVMLGLVFDRWSYFVRGRDEARTRLKVVPGVRSPGQVDVEVIARDAWQRVAWRKTLRAPRDKTTVVPMDLPTGTLGLFHVKLTARSAGKVVGIGINRYAILDPPVLEKTALRRPGRFGICQESFNFPVWLCEDHARIHTDLGVRLNRFFASIPPDLPDPIPAEFTADLLAKCAPFVERGIALLPCLELIPPSSRAAAQTPAMPTSKQLADFGRHAGAYVRALSPRVRHWEVFNEANLWRVPRGPDAGKRTMPPAKYLAFQKVAHEAIKGVDPDLQVYGGGLNNCPEDWIRPWMRLGAGRYMDAMSFHAYGWTNFYPQAVRLRAIMAEHGFTGPLVNTEKYYGCNLFHDRAGHEETRRGYYLLPERKGELRTAGRSIRHYVSHVAAGMPYCAYNPMGTLFRRGPQNELFLYDFFAAYNAATRFLVDAGRGRMLDLGPSMTAFLFPDAGGGPLVVLWTPLEEVEAALRNLPGSYRAYDIMGNRLGPDERAGGIRVANDPTYLRYPPGATAEQIRAAMARAEVIGLGDPVDVDLALTGPRRLSAHVTSCRNKPLAGTVTLRALPDGWKPAAAAKPFADLPAGKTARVDFDFQAMRAESLGSYPVSVLVECGEDFVRKDVTLRPLFAARAGAVRADGDLADWRGAEWLALGEGQLSKDFNPDLRRTGDADLSARVALGWLPDAVALAVDVTDDAHHTGPSAGLGWQGDSVQVYFDPKNDATAARPNTADDVEYIVSLLDGKARAWLGKGAQGNYKGEANKAEGFHDVDVAVAVRRTGGHTIYEMVFPRTQCLPGAALRRGGNLGFSLLINDSDGKGRKVGLTLAPKGSEPYAHPLDYRDLILK